MDNKISISVNFIQMTLKIKNLIRLKDINVKTKKCKFLIHAFFIVKIFKFFSLRKAINLNFKFFTFIFKILSFFKK